MTANNKSRPPYKFGDPEADLLFSWPFLIMGITFTLLQYLKPNWWWSENTGARILIAIVGEPIADIGCYIPAVGAVFAGIFLMRRGQQGLRARSEDASEDEQP